MDAIRSIKSVNASFRSFFLEAMTLVLTIKGRINFLQLAGYGKSCESRFRQNFRKPFDWLAFNMGLIKQQAGHLYAIAIDPSYLSKSGKHTPGIGYFWSGCAGAAKRGLEALGIALIDATTREAFALRVVQTIKGVISKGRPPKCVEHIEKDSLIRHYLLTLHKYSDRLLTLSNILVADAYFAKSTFVDGILQLGFHFIVWNGKTVITYSAVVNVISLERNVKVVVVDCLDDGKQCGIDYSIGKVKLLLHNAMMIERFISTFGKMTEHAKNKPPVFDDKNKLFKDLLFLGINDAA